MLLNDGFLCFIRSCHSSDLANVRKSEHTIITQEYIFISIPFSLGNINVTTMYVTLTISRFKLFFGINRILVYISHISLCKSD